MRIDNILLVDDEDLFHLVFDDACSLLDLTLNLSTTYSTDDAESKFNEWMSNPSNRPSCVFVDLNVIGSSFDGIELIRRVNEIYGNNIVIGIISSSCDPIEIEKAKLVGSQFWIVKSDDIEPRLEQFHADFDGYRQRTRQFTVYR